MPVQPYYAIQPAFTGGEVSQDIASRVDLDKYQLMLLRAKNLIVRPYGAVKRRPGTIYCGTTYGNGKVILQSFEFTSEIAYLLEFGVGYVRIWRDGAYLGIKLSTPYTESDLPKLRFAQNVDALYIASGRCPVKKLMRYRETTWAISDAVWDTMAYGDINEDETELITPEEMSGETEKYVLTKTSGFDGTAVGRKIKLEQYVAGTKENISINNKSETTATNPQWVENSWKITTHGTWAGTVYIETSNDNGGTWDPLRTYSGNKDYNPTETGDVEDGCLIRGRGEITDGTCKLYVSVFPYTQTSEVEIYQISDASKALAQRVSGTVVTGKATADWYWDAWCPEDGYPAAITFFQNRLVLGGSDMYPQRVWMSRTGRYEDFGTDKEDGTLTDDSAVTADLLSLRSYRIAHMEAANDLMVMTEGNTWTISGMETVTPTNITPRNQENYGIGDVPPIRVGNRMVYVQRRGSTVRDIGYSYETDSYGGQDLTILAKHLIQGYTITGSAYAQEPDSLLYFVRSDGVLLCLTYLHDQRVYAWSRIETAGEYESVAVVNTGNDDIVYAVVKREINGAEQRYIEAFDAEKTGSTQQDYVMSDCAIAYKLGSAATTITGLYHLEGEDVQVMGDGYYYDMMTVTGGQVVLPQPAKYITIGLPYKTEIEQLNFDAGMTEDGTLQGRKKTVTGAILRLSSSFGGYIGTDEKTLVRIPYEGTRMELGDNALYTGDLEVTLKTGGFGTTGRTYIEHEDPFPLHLSAIIRKVTVGG